MNGVREKLASPFKTTAVICLLCAALLLAPTGGGASAEAGVVPAAVGMRAASAATRKYLPAPLKVRAARYGNAYLVSWENVPNPRVVGYNVYRGYTKFPLLYRCRRVNASPVKGCSFLDETVCDFTRLQYYWVTAVYSPCAESAPAGPACIDPRVPDTAPPSPPAGLHAEVPAVGVRLTWSGGNTDPDFRGYNLYRLESDATATRLNGEPIRDSFFYFSGGKPGESYEARSVDTSGNESAGARAAASLLEGEVLDFVDPHLNTDPRVTYVGSWLGESYDWAHGGRLVVSGVEPGGGSAAGQVFVEVSLDGDALEGRSVELYCARYWQCGWCEVFLNGVSQGRVNLSIDSDYPQPGYLLYAVPSLGAGHHVLQVVNPGIPGPEEMPLGFVNVDYLVFR